MAIPGLKIIDDILAGLPENARLRQQLAEVREELLAAQKEILDLRSKLDGNKAEGIDPTVLKTLKFFFDQSREMSSNFVATSLGETAGIMDFHFDELKRLGYIRQTRAARFGGDGSYSLTAEGRSFAVKNLSSL